MEIPVLFVEVKRFVPVDRLRAVREYHVARTDWVEVVTLVPVSWIVLSMELRNENTWLSGRELS